MTKKKELHEFPKNSIFNQLRYFNAEEQSRVNVAKARGHGVKKYEELRVVETENGMYEELVQVDYPITADYVKSFESSANYKNDVEGAILNGTSAKNLGDTVDLSSLAEMDSMAIAELANKLKSASDYLQQQSQQQQSQQQQQKQVEEVVNNE